MDQGLDAGFVAHVPDGDQAVPINRVIATRWAVTWQRKTDGSAWLAKCWSTSSMPSCLRTPNGQIVRSPICRATRRGPSTAADIPHTGSGQGG